MTTSALDLSDIVDVSQLSSEPESSSPDLYAGSLGCQAALRPLLIWRALRSQNGPSVSVSNAHDGRKHSAVSAFSPYTDTRDVFLCDDYPPSQLHSAPDIVPESTPRPLAIGTHFMSATNVPEMEIEGLLEPAVTQSDHQSDRTLAVHMQTPTASAFDEDLCREHDANVKLISLFSYGITADTDVVSSIVVPGLPEVEQKSTTTKYSNRIRGATVDSDMDRHVLDGQVDISTLDNVEVTCDDVHGGTEVSSSAVPSLASQSTPPSRPRSQALHKAAQTTEHRVEATDVNIEDSLRRSTRKRKRVEPAPSTMSANSTQSIDPPRQVRSGSSTTSGRETAAIVLPEPATPRAVPVETADGRFACPHCPARTFQRYHDCRRHMDTSKRCLGWNGVVYPCRRCGSEYTRRDAVKRHMDDKPDFLYPFETAGHAPARSVKLRGWKPSPSLAMPSHSNNSNVANAPDVSGAEIPGGWREHVASLEARKRCKSALKDCGTGHGTDTRTAARGGEHTALPHNVGAPSGYKAWLVTTRRCPQHLALVSSATRHSPLAEMSYNPITSSATYPLDGPLDASEITLLFGQAMRLHSSSPQQAEQPVGGFPTPWITENSYLDVMRPPEDVYTPQRHPDVQSAVLCNAYDAMLFASKYGSEHVIDTAECLLSPPIDPKLIAHPRSYEIASALDDFVHAANSPDTLPNVSTCSDATLSGYSPSPSPYATYSSSNSDNGACDYKFTCSLLPRNLSSATTSRKKRSVPYHPSRPPSSSLTSTSSPSTSQTRKSKARRSPIRVRRRNVQIGVGTICTVEGCGKVLTKGAMGRHKETHRKQDKWRCCGIPVEMVFGTMNRSSDRRMIGGCPLVFSRKDALERHLKNPNDPCIGDVERAELLGWFGDASKE
ncbi:predicted protein [Postia placenta Mad-698-R]|nr:predicted protein [Postia placenta Mad-698-R]